MKLNKNISTSGNARKAHTMKSSSVVIKPPHNLTSSNIKPLIRRLLLKTIWIHDAIDDVTEDALLSIFKNRYSFKEIIKFRLV